MIHQRKRRPSRAGNYLLIAAVACIGTAMFIDRTPVRASTGHIIKMCEPIDAVEACKYIECRAEYEIEGFNPGKKPR